MPTRAPALHPLLQRRHALALSVPWLLGTVRAQSRPSTAGPTVQVLPERLAMGAGPLQGRERGLRVYLPPSYASDPLRRFPVLYLHDAQNLFDEATSYAGEWGVDETLDELARQTGFEAIAVGIDHGGTQRNSEFNPWPHPETGPGLGNDYIDFVVKVVKPFVDARWRTRPEVAYTAIAGSSMGGLVSHAAWLRHPGVFSRVGVFSPAYWVAPALLPAMREFTPPPQARVFLYAGDAESPDLVERVSQMHTLLRERGVASRLLVTSGARHHEAAWRHAFGPAVRWLFELPPA